MTMMLMTSIVFLISVIPILLHLAENWWSETGFHNVVDPLAQFAFK